MVGSWVQVLGEGCTQTLKRLVHFVTPPCIAQAPSPQVARTATSLSRAVNKLATVQTVNQLYKQLPI